MKDFLFNQMEGWYYIIGLIVTWIAALYCLLLVSAYLWKLFYQHVWLGSWVHHTIDYYRIKKRYIKNKEKADGRNIFTFELKLKYGYAKHHYKDKILKILPEILKNDPESKQQYDDTAIDAYEYRKNWLIRKRWIHEGDQEGERWEMPFDLHSYFTLKNNYKDWDLYRWNEWKKDVYRAFRLQMIYEKYLEEKAEE